MLTGNEGENFLEVRTQFLRGAGAARIVAGDSKAASRIAGRGGFESADVIALPAVQRDRR